MTEIRVLIPIGRITAGIPPLPRYWMKSCCRKGRCALHLRSALAVYASRPGAMQAVLSARIP